MNFQKKNNKNKEKIMSKKDRTETVAVYIFLIFIGLFLTMGIYFFSEKFFQKDEINFGQLINPEFNDLISNPSNVNNEENKQFVEIEIPGCIYQGRVFQDGDIVTMYSKTRTSSNDSCQNYQSQRRCSAGLMTGEGRFKYFQCEQILDCVMNENTIIKDGEYQEFYSRREVNFGNQCSKYKGKVRCVRGKLSGETKFKYKECSVSFQGTCQVGGQTLGKNKSHLFFSKNIVNFNENCNDFSQRRFCNQGNLQGDKKYKYWSCSKEKAKSCFVGGAKVLHGASKFFYSKAKPGIGESCKALILLRECQDGKLSGADKYSYSICE